VHQRNGLSVADSGNGNTKRVDLTTGQVDALILRRPQ